MGSVPQGYWNFLMQKDKKWQKTNNGTTKKEIKVKGEISNAV